MRSINCPGMDAHFNLERGQLHVGLNAATGARASIWQPSFKERLKILFGRNVLAIFYSGAHPIDVRLKISKQKETPINIGNSIVEVALNPDGSVSGA